VWSLAAAVFSDKELQAVGKAHDEAVDLAIRGL